MIGSHTGIVIFGEEPTMRRRLLWLTLILTAFLFFGCALADEAELPYFSDEILYLPKNSSIQLSYTVPEGYIVESAKWMTDIFAEWNNGFRNAGAPSPDRALAVIDQNGLLTTLGRVGKGRVEVLLNGVDRIAMYFIIETDENAFSYTVSDGGAVVTGFDDTNVEEFTVVPRTLGGVPVVGIGDCAFMQKNIVFVHLPDTITHIGARAFENCINFQNILLSANLKTLGKQCFMGSWALRGIWIPDGVKHIPDLCFAGCYSLGTDRVVLNQIETIGKEGFAYNERMGALERQILPDTLREIGELAFSACKYLQEIVIPDSVATIGEGAFSYCKRLHTATLPSALTDIPARLFMGSDKLCSAEIPDTVRHIGASAFEGCAPLCDALLGDGIETIGDRAFKDCSALPSLYLSEAAVIGEESFLNCSGIATISVCEGNPLYHVVDNALLTIDDLRLLVYPASNESASYALPQTVQTIDNGALNHLKCLKSLVLHDAFYDYRPGMFYNAASLESVVFGENTLTSIPERFFDGCTSLRELTGYERVASIGKYAFRGCASLPAIRFEEGLTTIAESAFEGCLAMMSAALPDSVSVVQNKAFLDCASLESFRIPNGVKTVYSQTFTNCAALCQVTFPATLEKIESAAFQNTGITEAALPEGLQTIASAAFMDCGALESVLLPASLRIIGGNAFRNCGALQQIVFPESITTIANGMLMNCGALQSVTLGGNTTVIGVSAFEGCLSLPGIDLPLGISDIGIRAFYGCASLDTLTFPPSLTALGRQAFGGCTGLSSVLIPAPVCGMDDMAFDGCSGSMIITGWRGSAAEALAEAKGLVFTAMDAALVFALNDAGDGYLLSGCDPAAYSVTIPSEYNGLPVVGLQDGVFSECVYLNVVNVPEESAYFALSEGVLLNASGDTLLYYPAAFTGTEYTVSESVRKIAPYAFYLAKAVNITLPDSIASIGENAFPKDTAGVTLYVGLSSYALEYAVRAGIHHVAGNPFFTYTLADGMATITGYSGTAEHIVVPAIIDGYHVRAIEHLESGNARQLTISEGIETIGYFGVRGCTALETVSLPDSLTVVEGYAFYYLSNLTSVRFGVGLREIGDYAFRNTALAAVDLPDGLQSIGEYAFADTPLTEISLPKGLTTLGGSFVSGCELLSSVYVDPLNASYEYSDLLLYDVPNAAVIFCPVTATGAIVVREGTKAVAGGAFQSCASITSVSLPDTVTALGSDAFRDCASLRSIRVPDGVTTIEPYAFYGCAALAEVTLPTGLKSILDYAFKDCVSLTNVDIPAGTELISYFAFHCCANLESVTLREGLKTIQESAFSYCAIEEIMLPASLTELSIKAFSSCPINTVDVAPGNARYHAQGGVLYDMQAFSIMLTGNSLTGEIIIPEGILTLPEHAFRNKTGITSVLLPDSLTGIEPGAFYECSSLASVRFGKNIQYIEQHAFSYSGLTEVVLPDTLQYIGEAAFYSCQELVSATIGAGITELRSTFNGCGKLRTVTLPESLAVIGAFTFKQCSSLASIDLPAAVREIGSFAFEDCESLTSIVLKNCTVGDSAFRQCVNLRTVTLDDSVTALGAEAFYGCAITEFRMPSAVTAVGAGMFANCASLRDVTLHQNVTEIGDTAFTGCISLEEIDLPKGIARIGNEAFGGCVGLKRIDLPSGLVSIGDGAFINCALFTSIALPESLEHIGSRAFASTGLTSVVLPDKVTDVSDEMFSNCLQLASVTLSEGTTRIGIGAFYSCLKLGDFALPASLTEIGVGAFMGCKQLTSVDLSQTSVLILENETFNQCESLVSIRLSAGLTRVGEKCFYRCLKLSSVSVDGSGGFHAPASLKSIGAEAFYYCHTLSSITLNDGLESIGDYAFYHCCSVQSLSVPDSVTAIGIHAAGKCTDLIYVKLPSGLQTVPMGLLGSDCNIGTLILPERCTIIKSDAFYDMSYLGSLMLPDTVTTIEQNAFRGCMMNLYVPNSVTSIHDGAFTDSYVTIYAEEDSAAAAFARAHGIDFMSVDGAPASLPSGSGAEAAIEIVREVITDGMDDYEKSYALLMWMKNNVDNVDTNQVMTSTKALVKRVADRWGYAYGYKELLDAAGVNNTIFFDAEGFVDQETAPGFEVSYMSGDAWNAICIDGSYTLTLAYNATDYSMYQFFAVNEDLYSGVTSLNMEDYHNTYVYREYCQPHIEPIRSGAQAAFDAGAKIYAHTLETNQDIVYEYFLRELGSAAWVIGGVQTEVTAFYRYDGSISRNILYLHTDLTGILPEFSCQVESMPYNTIITPQRLEPWSVTLAGTTMKGVLTVEETALLQSGEIQVTFVPDVPELLGDTIFSIPLTCVLPNIFLTSGAYAEPRMNDAERPRIVITSDKALLLPEGAAVRFQFNSTGESPVSMDVDDLDQYMASEYQYIIPVEKGVCGLLSENARNTVTVRIIREPDQPRILGDYSFYYTKNLMQLRADGKSYDGQPAEVSATTCSDGEIAMQYAVWADLGDGAQWQPLNEAPTDAGRYRVTAVLQETEQFLSETDEREYTISKAHCPLRVSDGYVRPCACLHPDDSMYTTESDGTISIHYDQNGILYAQPQDIEGVWIAEVRQQESTNWLAGRIYYEYTLAAHTPTVDPAVPPTETGNGLTEGSHCAVCETILDAQEIVTSAGYHVATAVQITDAVRDMTVGDEAYAFYAEIACGTKALYETLYGDLAWTCSDERMLALVRCQNLDWQEEGYHRLYGALFKPIQAGAVVVTATTKDGYQTACSTLVIVHDSAPLVLPSAVAAIEAEAFSGISAREIVLSDGILSIGEKAFADNQKLRLIYLPGSITSIAADAFNSCESLTILCSPGSYAEAFAAARNIPCIAR